MERDEKEAEERKQMEQMADDERPLLRRWLGDIDDEPQGNRNRQKRARDETFFRSLKINLCPTLRCCTFTILVVMINIIMYLISLWLYGIVNTEFLAPNPRALDKLGWKDARKIKRRN